ncbi:MAG TPA: alpha/beta hydrolase [Pseudonocardiaceae bacterium]|jgi:pimeloyl-ACP methyl ester carboxylesterase|nr:alpha/beta hydrolase [Pseudonocardiaceae bacterium]
MMPDNNDTTAFVSTKVELGEMAFNVIDVGEGSPVLLLHGFPDRATMWRHQIHALLKAGHRVIAPDLRGFGDSSKPDRVEDYALPLVLHDITGLLDHLGIDSVSVAGHDWGALLGWLLAGTTPERVNRLAALSVGHPDAVFGAGFTQKQLSWYVLWFQFPDIAEEQMPTNDWSWYRQWIHNGRLRDDDIDLDRQLTDLARPGALTAGLSWYRANLSPEIFALNQVNFGMSTITCPVLGIWSDGDPALGEQQMTDSEKYLSGPWRYEKITGVDHWIPTHATTHTNELLTEFFT